MSSLPLSPEQQNIEWQTILDIANSNNLPEHIIIKLRTTIQNPNKNSVDDNKQKKWTTFTYHFPKIRKVTNLFKHTNTKIAYRTSNKIAQRTRTANSKPTHDFEKSGIYKLECRTCHKAYVGQISRTLKIRCREHMRYIMNNNSQSAYATHILETGHEYGNMADILSMLRPVNRATLLLPYEQLFFQTFHQHDKLIPEQHAPNANPILQLT
jgi:hypothetical protein